MKEISDVEVRAVGGGFINCSTLPPPISYVCQVAAAGAALAAALIATDSNAGSTTNLSDVNGA